MSSIAGGLKIIDDGKSKKELLQVGEALLASHQCHKALKFFEEALIQDEDNEHLNFGKAEALYWLNKKIAALRYYDKVIKLNPLNGKAHIGRADTLRRLSRDDEALTSINIAYSLLSEDPDANFSKARILLASNRRDSEFYHRKALSLFKSTITSNTDNVSALSRIFFRIGQCYQEGWVFEPDKKELYQQTAAHWLLKAAELGHVAAQCDLGIVLQCITSAEQNYKQAVFWLAKAAAEGNEIAEYNLGVMFEQGRGVAQDYKEALKWFRKAALQGNVEATRSFGLYLENGQGIDIDKKAAAEWLRIAAQQGDVIAQYTLGIKYKKGDGIEKNNLEAMKWLHQAAVQGYALAQSNLGLMLYNNNGGPMDKVEAAEWFRKAAYQGDRIGRNMLGVFLLKDQETTEDVLEALFSFYVASEQSCVDALYNLGLFLLEGWAGVKDLWRAELLFLAVIKRGMIEAREDLTKTTLITQNNFSTFEEAISHYQTALKSAENPSLKVRLLSIMGFCYQIGLGVSRDVKRAQRMFEEARILYEELYKKEINIGANCHLDLYLCNLRLYEMEQIKLQELTAFYSSLKSSYENTKDEKIAILLARIHEKTSPGCDQNLFIALGYYQDTSHMIDTDSDCIKMQAKTLFPLYNLRSTIYTTWSKLNINVSGIIAEYALPPSTKNPSRVNIF